MNDNLDPKSSKHFYCNNCNYITSKKSQYNRHISTEKHIKMTRELQENTNNNKYICKCGKNYKYRQGLHKHRQISLECSQSNNEKKNVNTQINSSLIINIIKENQEFKETILREFKDLFLQQNKEHNELINKFIEREPTQIINTTNNNNQTFNLNVFLNETCKDAMNVKEFLENLNPTLDDLENVGEKGFVKGISDIILRSLRELEITKRPIHCTDIKREIVYLKEDDTWNKDDKDNSKMKELIRIVENKNFNNVFEWQVNHPDVMILDSPDYMKRNILIETSCEAVDKEDRVRGKVLKELLKEIHINKENIQ